MIIKRKQYRKFILKITCNALVALLIAVYSVFSWSLPGEVLSHQKISDTAGAFTGSLLDGDQFGQATTSLGSSDA